MLRGGSNIELESKTKGHNWYDHKSALMVPFWATYGSFDLDGLDSAPSQMTVDAFAARLSTTCCARAPTPPWIKR